MKYLYKNNITGLHYLEFKFNIILLFTYKTINLQRITENIWLV